MNMIADWRADENNSFRLEIEINNIKRIGLYDGK